MKGYPIHYSKAELQYVKQNCTLPRKELTLLFNKKFNRNVSVNNLKSLRQRNGWLTGRTGGFEKGQKAWNKGKPFKARGRSPETQFKKGNKPHNWKPIGTERTSEDGILQIKIADNRNHSDWANVHVLLWQKQNDPIPKGKFLVFINKDPTDIRIENLCLVNRSENMKRNSVHNMPKELASLCQLRGVLTRKINQREQNEKQN